MTLRTQQIVVVSDASGTGSGQSPAPVNGYVVGARIPGVWGGTADYAFTSPSEEGGGTLFSIANTAGPQIVYAGGSIAGGGSGAWVGGAPCDGHLRVAIAEATPSTSGTVVIYTDGR